MKKKDANEVINTFKKMGEASSKVGGNIQEDRKKLRSILKGNRPLMI
jgi:hypothetical protein